MRIGIDARMLGIGYGIGRYIQELITHLHSLETGDDFVVFLRKENWDLFEPTNSKWQKALVDIPWYGWQEQIFFPFELKKYHLDLIHYPHWNIPLLSRVPFVLTLHDLTMFHFPRPEASTRGRPVYWMKHLVHTWVVRFALKKATHIIAPSEYVKMDAIKTFSLFPEKITTIYEAPFAPKSSAATVGKEILTAHTIRTPYVLYVGAAYPHKNLDRLVESWRIAREKFTEPFTLLFVGQKNYFYDRLLETIQNDKDIIYFGGATDEELHVLYKNAKLFIFPSLSEGFGLPPLEAIMHGLPVLSSTSSCLPEILGEGVLYFDPTDANNIATTILHALGDKELLFDLKQKGKEELTRYSWSKAALATAEVYKKSL